MKPSAPLFRLKRQASQLARAEGLARHQALDRIARREGFRSWSHLCEAAGKEGPAARLLDQLDAGDLVLLGARPGQGKTLLGLELAARAAERGRCSFFFTLEYGGEQLRELLRAAGCSAAPRRHGLVLDTSDEISASYIAQRLEGAGARSLAVIDYLQLLDQKRSHPPLAEQLRRLKALAASSGAILIAIAQIDRSFDSRRSGLPGLSDVRLPNPADLSLFSKACFLRDGTVRLEAVA
jgi:hypothetical protein